MFEPNTIENKNNIVETNTVETKNNIVENKVSDKNKNMKSEWSVVSPKPVKLSFKNDEHIVISRNPTWSDIESIVTKYLLNKNSNEVYNYIETKCGDANNKNRFCECLLNKYFMSSEETILEIINLMKQLIKFKILYKSNLSRGLLLIYNHCEENSNKFIKPTERMKNILQILKNFGITKGLEFLIEKYS
jgi:hypothetical protein